MVREVIVDERFITRQLRNSHGSTLQRNGRKSVSIGSESLFLEHLMLAGLQHNGSFTQFKRKALHKVREALHGGIWMA